MGTIRFFILTVGLLLSLMANWSCDSTNNSGQVSFQIDENQPNNNFENGDGSEAKSNSNNNNAPDFGQDSLGLIESNNPATDVAPNLGSNGGNSGGGSQGALQKAGTGNPDEREPGPDGVCGNEIQEALPYTKVPCPFRIYGTVSKMPNQLSSLYYLNESTGVGTLIGDIIGDTEVFEILAIDFSPAGQLYGVGRRADNNMLALYELDCFGSGGGAQARLIGNTDVENIITDEGINNYYITDLDFDPHGQLLAYLDTDSSTEVLGSLNILTGLWTTIGEPTTADPGLGNGIGSAPFPESSLYHANDVELSTLDTTDATTTLISNLSFPFPVDGDLAQINGMDLDIFNNIMYVSVLDVDQINWLNKKSNPSIKTLDPDIKSYLAKINLNTGAVVFLPQGPELAPEYLQSVAVNQRYEECDDPDLVLRSIKTKCTNCDVEDVECSEDCKLREINCENSIDDDFDGLIDCLDPDCDMRSCDDGLFCTIEDTCINNICVGETNTCDDYNSCTTDSCSEESGCEHEFDESKTSWGSCEKDGESCTIGRCVEVEGNGNGNGNGPALYLANGQTVGDCQEVDRSFVSAEEGGCRDENQCTADSCIQVPKPPEIIFPDDDDADDDAGSTAQAANFNGGEIDNEYQCVQESMEWSPCFVEEACQPGVCMIVENSPQDMEIDLLTVECVQQGNGDPQTLCPNLDSNPCTTETCEVGIGCQSLPLSDNTPCNDYDPCTVNDVCRTDMTRVNDNFYCFGTPKIKVPENQDGGDDENPCTMDMCSGGDISHMPFTGPSGIGCVPQGEFDPPRCGTLQCVEGQLTEICEDFVTPAETGDLCFDNIDNDCNGLIDSQEPECVFFAFVTSLSFTGTLESGLGNCDNQPAGLDRGDCICQYLADNSNNPVILGKTFVAWLSTDVANATDSGRVEDQGLGYQTVTNNTIATSHFALLNPPPLNNPINVTEEGNASLSTVWTGTLPDGSSSSVNCGNWTNSGLTGSTGADSQVDDDWTDIINLNCSLRNPLYCFERADL